MIQKKHEPIRSNIQINQSHENIGIASSETKTPKEKLIEFLLSKHENNFDLSILVDLVIELSIVFQQKQN